MRYKQIPTYYYPPIERIENPIIEPEVPAVKTIQSGLKPVQDLNGKLTQIAQLEESMKDANIPYKDLQNTVMYDGNPNSPIMFIGEAPGEQEVVQRKPFVGKSGKLLQEMLDHAGILRQNIYVTNVVVWRPPNNKTPMPDEIEAMRPYLLEHIRIINPKLIVLVGGIAYRGVMQEVIAISKIRGIWQNRDFCSNIINIFHPSYLLRSPIHRRESWRDILAIRQRALELGCREYLAKGSLAN